MSKSNKSPLTTLSTITGIAEVSGNNVSKALDGLTYLDDSSKLVITEIHKAEVMAISYALMRLMQIKGINLMGDNLSPADIHKLCDSVEKMKDVKPSNPDYPQYGDTPKSRFN